MKNLRILFREDNWIIWSRYLSKNANNIILKYINNEILVSIRDIIFDSLNRQRKIKL
jgi:hypothetical protein